VYVSVTQFDFSSNSQITVSCSRNGTNWATANASTLQTFPTWCS
jgi:hypothetical protein